MVGLGWKLYMLCLGSVQHADIFFVVFVGTWCTKLLCAYTNTSGYTHEGRTVNAQR